MATEPEPAPAPRSASARGTFFAVIAAVLFGGTTPLVKHYGAGVAAFTTAALLYAGSLAASVGPRRGSLRLRPRDVARVAAAAILGASVAPALFAWGLARVSGGAGGLFLTCETAATAVFARLILGERISPRAGIAIGLIAIGSILLAGSDASASAAGGAAIVLATFAWALDAVITRPLADVDAVAVVRWKSGVGAALSGVVALVFEPRPVLPIAAAVGLIVAGAVGYGLSLRAYLAAQTAFGAARTGSVFAVAPFVAAVAGALAAWTLPGISVGLAALPIALGVMLHATERPPASAPPARP
jgi:drug/metabolite transporter (DMT)-like permease